MRNKRLASCIVTACMVLGFLSGCTKTTILHSIPEAEVVSAYGHNISVKEHTIEKFTEEPYTMRDTVSVTYKPDDLGGLLPQTVSKDLEFRLNGTSNTWEFMGETTTACETDNSKLPGSSWKCEGLPSDVLRTVCTWRPRTGSYRSSG